MSSGRVPTGRASADGFDCAQELRRGYQGHAARYYRPQEGRQHQLPRRGTSPAAFDCAEATLTREHSQKLSSQARLFKSLKLWSFYVDLEESIGTVETTKAVYDKIFELKIANAQVVINFANFLEENEYWEESFKVRSHDGPSRAGRHATAMLIPAPTPQVYERGVDLFTYPIAFEIWNTYLTKFIKRYVSPRSLSTPPTAR